MNAPDTPSASRPTLWRVAQVVALLATVALLAGLVLRPETALDVLWNVLIPLVPASLLISPMIWRNVCPLATLNLLSGRGTRTLQSALIPGAGLVGMLLLAVLVPARRFLFNTDGLALAITVAAVALLALGLGRLFDMKAGFCNSICPVLPVERLYGQHPLVQIGNPRCVPCTMCTARACIDLSPARSIPATIPRNGRHWLARGYGIFAAAFPGFVYGYYTLADGPLSSFSSVYLHVGLWSAISYLASASAVAIFRPRLETAMTLLATSAISLYYWFAADAITRAFEIAGSPTVALRTAAFALVALWTWHALAERRGSRAMS